MVSDANEVWYGRGMEERRGVLWVVCAQGVVAGEVESEAGLSYIDAYSMRSGSKPHAAPRFRNSLSQSAPVLYITF